MSDLKTILEEIRHLLGYCQNKPPHDCEYDEVVSPETGEDEHFRKEVLKRIEAKIEGMQRKREKEAIGFACGWFYKRQISGRLKNYMLENFQKAKKTILKEYRTKANLGVKSNE